MADFLTLYLFEWKKLWKRKLVKIASACLFAVAVFTVISPMLGNYSLGVVMESNADGVRKDAAYREALDGKLLNQELLTEVYRAYGKVPYENGKYSGTEEYQTYARPYSAVFNQVRQLTGWNTETVISGAPREEEVYQRWNEVLEKSWKSEYLSEGEISFWQNKKQEIETPIRFEAISDGFYELLLGISEVGLVSVFVVMLCLAGVFPEEHSQRTDQMVLCCKHGKRLLYKVKMAAGITFAVAISLGSAALAIGLAFLLYGTAGFDAPFYLYMTGYLYPITMGEATLIGYAMVLAACVITAVITMVLSELVQSSLTTVSAATAVVVAGMFLNIPGKYRILAQLWDYLPSRFTMSNKIFNNRMVPLFEGYLQAWQAVPMLYVLLGIVFVWIGKLAYDRYQVTGR